MSWETVELDTVADINPRMPRGLADDLDVSFLPMAAVSEDGQIDYQEQRTVEQVRKGYTYFRRGDVLVAKITPCFENGKATKTDVLDAEHGFGSTEFHVIRANPDELLPEYAFYLVWNPYFRKEGTANMTGSAGQKRVPADFLKRLKIPLPPLEEQRRIAGILDAADALRRRRREALALLDTLPGAIFVDMFGDYKNNRHSWETVTFSEACADRTSKSPKVKARDYADAGNLPVVDQGAALVAGFVDNLDLANTSPLPVVVFGDHTRHVKLIDFPFATGADGAKVLEPGDGFNAEYLAECISALPLPELGYSRHMRELKRQEFPKPPVDQQAAFSDRIAAVREQRRRLEGDLQQLETLFASLQSRAFSGEL